MIAHVIRGRERSIRLELGDEYRLITLIESTSRVRGVVDDVGPGGVQEIDPLIPCEEGLPGRGPFVDEVLVGELEFHRDQLGVVVAPCGLDEDQPPTRGQKVAESSEKRQIPPQS